MQVLLYFIVFSHVPSNAARKGGENKLFKYKDMPTGHKRKSILMSLNEIVKESGMNYRQVKLIVYSFANAGILQIRKIGNAQKIRRSDFAKLIDLLYNPDFTQMNCSGLIISNTLTPDNSKEQIQNFSTKQQSISKQEIIQNLKKAFKHLNN